MLRSQAVSAVLSRLDREVKEGHLSIRSDKICCTDIGLRDTLLLKIMSFNMYWLRPALEALFGEEISRSHAVDSVNVFRFLAANLIKSQDIASKYGVTTNSSELNTAPEYYTELNQRVLTYFLSLVLLLDTCKSEHALERDPCLFTRAPEVLMAHGPMKVPSFKSTRDMLVSFSKEFLSGEGDVLKHLGSLGYTLKFQQTAIEEYDFTAKNLSTDLRDGIRLARLAEIVTERFNFLSPKLRVPAISRLQKVGCIACDTCHAEVLQEMTVLLSLGAKLLCHLHTCLRPKT